MLVKEIMKRPLAVEKDISLSDAARLMSEKNIGSLLFISGSKIKGIITERDLMKNFSKNDKISHIMSTKVITIEPDENLDRATELMREYKIKRLPVINEGKLVGIITMTDIMANFEALEEEFFFE
jgi:CBS domain-containing protein